MSSAAHRDAAPQTTGEDAGSSCSCPAELGWGLSTVMRAFGRWASASVIDLPGGPRGHLVLATIARDRPPSQLALAHELGVDRTAMTYLLDELETAGLVERRPDPADRRARQILITPAGSNALREYSKRLFEVENRLLAPLDELEAKTFRHMIERIARAAHTEPAGSDPCRGENVQPACPDSDAG